MRLAFVRLMREHSWPEAIDSLIELLADKRNFGSHWPMGGTWSRFSVPRSAALALGAYEGLPDSALKALLKMACQISLFQLRFPSWSNLTGFKLVP